MQIHRGVKTNLIICVGKENSSFTCAQLHTYRMKEQREKQACTEHEDSSHNGFPQPLRLWLVHQILDKVRTKDHNGVQMDLLL